MKNVTQNWIGLVEYDMDTAEAMFVSGRYLYVLFCCQQAIEKALKAIYVERLEELPPRTHNLETLAEMIKLDFPKERNELYNNLLSYYISSRYADDIRKLSEKVTRIITENLLKQTKDEIKWLLSII